MTIGVAIRKMLKIAGLAVAGLALLAFLAGAAYVIRYYPRPVKTREIHTPALEDKLLIATQGSGFKNAIVDGVCSALERRPAYVKVVDVDKLDEIDPDGWSGIVVLNTVMMDKMDGHVRRFLERGGVRDDTLLMVTAGGGDFRPLDLPVDAISGASRPADTDRLVTLIVDWIDQRGSPAWQPSDPLVAMEYFIHWDIARGCEAIRARSERYRERYPLLEARLNRIGYDRLRRGEPEAALVAFRLNCELFPDSWNAHDSCGEAQWRCGDRGAALASYRRSLELNPDSVSGREAVAQLSLEHTR